LIWDREQHASERVAITVRSRTDAEQRWENDRRRAQAEMESARPDARGERMKAGRC
jgi:hypothetical protein